MFEPLFQILTNVKLCMAYVETERVETLQDISNAIVILDIEAVIL